VAVLRHASRGLPIGRGGERRARAHALPALYRASDLDQCLFTIGIVYLWSRRPPYLYGTLQQPINTPPYLQGAVEFLGMRFGVYRLFLIVTALVITAILVAALEYTRFGAQVACGCGHPRMARGSGWTWTAPSRSPSPWGGGLAGLGGGREIEIVGLDHAFAFTYLVYVLIVVAVGGLGSIGGSFVAAAVLGISDMAGKYYFPAARRLFHLSLMIALLIWRASGLVRKTLRMRRETSWISPSSSRGVPAQRRGGSRACPTTPAPTSPPPLSTQWRGENMFLLRSREKG